MGKRDGEGEGEPERESEGVGEAELCGVEVGERHGAEELHGKGELQGETEVSSAICRILRDRPQDHAAVFVQLLQKADYATLGWRSRCGHKFLCPGESPEFH